MKLYLRGPKCSQPAGNIGRPMWRTLQRAAPAFVPAYSDQAARMPLLLAKACATQQVSTYFVLPHVLLLTFLAPLAWADAGVLIPSTSKQPDPRVLTLDEMSINVMI